MTASDLLTSLTSQLIPRRAPDQNKIQEACLIVVHPSVRYDWSNSSGEGINLWIQKGRVQNKQIVYLLDIYDDSAVFCRSQSPDFAVNSLGGEHNLKMVKNEIYLVGGYATGCYFNALVSCISNYIGTYPLIMKLPAEAIYNIDLPNTQNLKEISEIHRMRILLNWEKRLKPRFKDRSFCFQINSQNKIIQENGSEKLIVLNLLT